ncbi:MAG: hypothetical protein ACREOI_13340 [bacterium]
MKNLDALCATIARQMVAFGDEAEKRKKGGRKETLNRLTNGLGVLQEDGVYAFFLFLKREDLADKVWPIFAGLLRNEAVGRMLPDAGSKSEEDLLIEMTENLDHLLLAKDLLQRTLIYARYGLRAL